MIYDGNGNVIEVGGSEASSNFDVTNYGIAVDEEGNSVRKGTLLYNDKEFLPKTTQENVKTVPKQYDGVMIAFGDSYTVGIGDKWDTFASKHGMIVDKQGVIGSSYHGTDVSSPLPYWIRLDTIIEEYSNGKAINETTYTAEDVKLITVMGGANDGWSKSAIGDSIYTTDKNTIYGACHYVFGKILQAFPNADVVCILQPIQWTDGTSTAGLTDDETAKTYGFDTVQDAKNLDGFGYANFTSSINQFAIRQVAELYGLTICDCALNWYKRIGATDSSKYWREDGHMTSDGYQAVIDQLEETVNYLRFTRN